MIDKQTLEKIERATSELGGQVTRYRASTLERFPLLFVLLTTFGLVATLYGFEKVIDSIPLFADRGWLVLVIGVGVLIFTGTLYKKLR